MSNRKAKKDGSSAGQSYAQDETLSRSGFGDRMADAAANSYIKARSLLKGDRTMSSRTLAGICLVSAVAAFAVAIVFLIRTIRMLVQIF